MATPRIDYSSRLTPEAYALPEKIVREVEYDYKLLYKEEPVIASEGKEDKDNVAEGGRTPFQAQFYALIDALEFWGIANECCPQEVIPFFVNFKARIFEVSYSGSQPSGYFDKLKKNLELIWFKLNDETISLLVRKKVFSDLYPGLAACAPGLPTHIAHLRFRLEDSVSLPLWLGELRMNIIHMYAELHIAKRARQFRQTQRPELRIERGNEIHAVNAFIQEGIKQKFNPLTTVDETIDHHIILGSVTPDSYAEFKEYFNHEYSPQAIVKFVETNISAEIHKRLKMSGVEEVKSQPGWHATVVGKSYTEFQRKFESMFTKLNWPVSIDELLILNEDDTAFQVLLEDILALVPLYLSIQNIFTEHLVFVSSFIFPQDFEPFLKVWEFFQKCKNLVLIDFVHVTARLINQSAGYVNLIQRMKILIQEILNLPELGELFYLEIKNKITFVEKCLQAGIKAPPTLSAYLVKLLSTDPSDGSHMVDAVIGKDCQIYSRAAYEKNKENFPQEVQVGKEMHHFSFPFTYDLLNNFNKAADLTACLAALKKLALDPLTGKLMRDPVMAVFDIFDYVERCDRTQVLVCDRETLETIHANRFNCMIVKLVRHVDFKILGALIALHHPRLNIDHVPIPNSIVDIFDATRRHYKAAEMPNLFNTRRLGAPQAPLQLEGPNPRPAPKTIPSNSLRLMR